MHFFAGDYFRLGQQANVARLTNPAVMGLAHCFQTIGVLWIRCEVVHLVWVVFQVVQFLDRLAARRKKPRRAGQATDFFESPNLLHRRPFFRRIHVLVVRLERFVVADVAEAAVSHHADDVVTLVHPVACSVYVSPCCTQFSAEKSATLHVPGNIDTGEVEHCRREINRTDQL